MVINLGLLWYTVNKEFSTRLWEGTKLKQKNAGPKLSI